MSPSPEPADGQGPRPGPMAIAHRGRHDLHPENTMEAFRAAYDAGCDMVEFDVQLSRDGIPFLFHDDDGRRLAGRPEAVSDLDWKTLHSWTLSPGPGGQAAGYRLPTLEQFLQEFGSRAFYLELKVPEAKAGDETYWQTLGETCAALVRSSAPRPETFLASFHLPVLSHLARGPAFPNLVGIFESLDDYQEALITQAPVRRYSLSWEVYQDALRTTASPWAPRAEAGRILLWNVATEADMQAAKADGVYGLCADDVGAMLRVCKGR